MTEDTLKILQTGSEDAVYKAVVDFNNKHAQSFSFPSITVADKQKLLDGIFGKLQGSQSSRNHMACLQTVRILSREKSGMEALTKEGSLKILVQHAGLQQYAQQQGENITIQSGDYDVMTEALKCLCNILFNSEVARRMCCCNGSIEGIVQRLKTYKDPELVHAVKFFDLRVLFLLTALCVDIRPKICHDLHGFTYLIEVLDLSLQDAEESSLPIGDKDVELSCEILKILFNLTVSVDKNNLDEEEEAHFMRLVSVLHDLLVAETASKDKKEDLVSHIVNLLTNMPRESYEELLTPLTEGTVIDLENKDVEYDGKNMEAIVVLLEFLSKRLDTPKSSLKESLTPALHCLCEVCRANRSIRKFCRLKVLPYLGDDVKRLPEEGPTIRNKVVKLFTSPVTEVKDLAADFMFVLCKESVSRFVKYTGYGNAAGLLAQRGLMCGGNTPGEYSSESENSETEEYSELKANVNPVTGRWEVPRPNPMEGMSEEQKEYEAMQLVQKLDQLTRQGIIQPTAIGPDGKPHAVEHIGELAEHMARVSASAATGAEGGTLPPEEDATD